MPHIEFWFHKRSGKLEIVNFLIGKRLIFDLVKTEYDSRFDYGAEDDEDTVDPVDYFGASGFTRVRVWEKELKGYNPETMENEDDL